jgi:transposase
MDHIQGTERSQTHLLPPSVEEYVPAEAPVRAIDAFVDSLDLRALGFSKAETRATGRPPYHPGDLLKLYLYGYLHRIRSSRRLEAETVRNLEVMWLLRTLRPDFKTIAEFRKDNIKAFKGVFREFNLLCRQLDLFGAELAAVDGSKFKAQNSSRRHFSQDQLRELIRRIDKRIEGYLSELDAQDKEAAQQQQQQSEAATTPGGGGQGLKEKIEKLRARRGGAQDRLSALEAAGQSEQSLSDADARKMKNVQQGGFFIGYNVQAAVDTRHDLIVAHEVVQEACDRGQLGAMALAASQELQAPGLQVVADKGYHSAEELARCEAAGITAFVPPQASRSGTSSKDGSQVFGKEQFGYDAARDVYHCPGGADLKRRGQSGTQEQPTVSYSNAAACRQCVLQARCTTAKNFQRVITRGVHEAAAERAAERLQGRSRELMAVRRESVEHVFGTLRLWGHDSFLLKTLGKVRGEFSLSALSYNLRRVLNLKTVAELLEALKTPAAA